MDDDAEEAAVVTPEATPRQRSPQRRIGEGRRPRPNEPTLLEDPAAHAPASPAAQIRRAMGGPPAGEPMPRQPPPNSYPSHPPAPEFHMEPPGQTQLDDLQSIVHNTQYPLVLRILAQRLAAAEQHLPDTMRVGQSLIQLDTRMRQIEPQVQHLSTQRAVAEMSLERQTRSMALDLAIKTVPEDQRAGPDAADTIVILADAFLAWMKTGENHY